MGAHTMPLLVLGGVGLAVVIWFLHKIGKALTAIFEVVAAAAVVFFALWGAVRAGVWLVKEIGTHWRTTLSVLVVSGWVLWLDWLSLAITLAVVTVGLLVWRWRHRPSFDPYAGRHIRSWWQRWMVYARKLPQWLRACGLTVQGSGTSVVINANPLSRNKIRPESKRPTMYTPRVIGVRSGPSWDEVRVRLVPGQKPEDFDEAARALASARGVSRCQVRELTPNVVSIDFQRRNLLADPVACADLGALAELSGTAVDLRRVFSGRTEYGTAWVRSLIGSHELGAGATGAGKSSLMWCPLISIAPAIRDGLVRVSGVDPKGMELAYGRRIFSRYAVTGTDALELLDDLVSTMDDRKREFAGQVRSLPISAEYPLELLEFDEIGALTKYTDRKTREQITERLSLLTTQGRALGVTVRGYVQEPTKDTVPVRDLFPRRVCLRVAARSHVGMVLGDQAYERGAWANRIGESEAGVGYLFGEGIREPLRVRAGWVPDEVIKALEAFVTHTPDGPSASVLSLPPARDRELAARRGGGAA